MSTNNLNLTMNKIFEEINDGYYDPSKVIAIEVIPYERNYKVKLIFEGGGHIYGACLSKGAAIAQAQTLKEIITKKRNYLD